MKKVHIYNDHIEQTALDQFDSAMSQDFAVKGALMPDAHTGYSLPIGAVVATRNVIVPAWVGYDIGCGMCAIPTTGGVAGIEGTEQDILNRIFRDIPTGFAHNQKDTRNTVLNPDNLTAAGRAIFDKNGYKQLGSLGGGNHFIELGTDEIGKIWVIIHSGSRGIGHAIASYYMRLASGDGKAREGHFGFDVDSQEGRDYIQDMNFGLQFALENRKEMLSRIEQIFDRLNIGLFEWDKLINRNHNHAEYNETEGLWIHRKGATHAEVGMMGVIPGNMRDGSFIVQGKGNPNALYSSSHGAGRVLGRKQAQKTLSMDEFRETMKGICGVVTPETLDESPMAYKNIFEVMELQKDLVDVLHHIKPLINIKAKGEC